MNIKLTNAGIALVQKGELGTKGVYTKIVLGDGYLADGQTLVNSTQVNNPVLNITDLILESDEEKVVVKGSFINESEFYLREIGLYARDTELGEVLCAYGNDGDEAKLVAVSDMERPIRIRQLYNNALSEFEETIFATLEDLASKVDKIDGMGLSSNDYTAEDLEKLAGIEEEANNYVHPETHLAEMIETDPEHLFITEEEKGKLESIEENANYYEHPETHSASMIITDPEHRFVTDTQIALFSQGGGSTGENESLIQHVSNQIVHVTQDERDRWNGSGGGGGQGFAFVGRAEYHRDSYYHIRPDEPAMPIDGAWVIMDPNLYPANGTSIMVYLDPLPYESAFSGSTLAIFTGEIYYNSPVVRNNSNILRVDGSRQSYFETLSSVPLMLTYYNGAWYQSFPAVPRISRYESSGNPLTTITTTTRVQITGFSRFENISKHKELNIIIEANIDAAFYGSTTAQRTVTLTLETTGNTFARTKTVTLMAPSAASGATYSIRQTVPIKIIGYGIENTASNPSITVAGYGAVSATTTTLQIYGFDYHIIMMPYIY